MWRPARVVAPLRPSLHTSSTTTTFLTTSMACSPSSTSSSSHAYTHGSPTLPSSSSSSGTTASTLTGHLHHHHHHHHIVTHEDEERQARALRWAKEGTQPEATRSKPKVLVLHGAGLNMRGKVEIERFGPLTLADYERHIIQYALEHRLDVEFFHSNSEGSVIDRLYAAFDAGDIDGAIINPGGFTKGYRALGLACGQVGFPVVEVHMSNTAANGTVSEITPHCKATVQGFGIQGYKMALAGLAELLSKKDKPPQ